MERAKLSTEKARAALAVVAAVAEVIRELGTVPSGDLYARVMGHISLEEYEKLIGILKGTGLVSESAHQLKWIGSEKEVR